MIGDVRFQMPSMESVDFADPVQVQEYFGSFAKAVDFAFKALTVKMNDPTMIMVPGPNGGRPLSEAIKETMPMAGDLKATVASRAKALRQQGWVPLDGKNGTPDSIDAFVIGAEEASDPGIVVVGSADVETSEPTPDETEKTDSTPETVLEDDGCGDGVEVAGQEHQHPIGHTHLVGVSAHVKSFTALWMMKL